ncbi:MAG: alpha/beta hydrolase-fold protein [Bacteroidota bacterium]
MKFSFTVFTLLLINSLSAQTPKASAGSIQHFENFKSKYVDARNVDVWLPEGYDKTKKYDVLYMHDGQMLFDSAITWTKVAWDVDEMATKLSRAGKIREVIVVGIWNSGKGRHSDYFPQKPFETLTQAEKDSVYSAARSNGFSVFNGYKIHSDDYLKFIVLELKPLIDKQFSTKTGPKHTFIAGSSMGGLISIYAVCEYPKVFGGAACLSTHWPGIFTMVNNPVPDAMFAYLKTHLPKPRKTKIYFDYGDQTLDAMYPPLQRQVDVIMRQKGFKPKHWITRFFPGENHSEVSWRKRLDVPLLFLLGK